MDIDKIILSILSFVTHSTTHGLLLNIELISDILVDA